MPDTSPLPWKRVDNAIVDANNAHVAAVGYTMVFDPRQLADAELIVAAVNAHSRLLAIARRVADHFADTDAPLGIDARAAIKLAEGNDA